MDVKKNIGREELVAILKSVSASKLNSERAAEFLDFVTYAMHFYPDADYLARPAQDIFWNLWGLCRFSAESVEATNAENRARVRVFQRIPGENA